jgi:hypothetical protein
MNHIWCISLHQVKPTLKPVSPLAPEAHLDNYLPTCAVPSCPQGSIWITERVDLY